MANEFFGRLMDTGEFRFNENGILFYFGAPTMLFNINTMVSLQKDLEEKNVAEESLKKVGGNQSRRALKRYEDRYNFDELSRNEIMKFIDDLTDVIALGEFTISKMDQKEDIVYAIENRTNPIARVYRKEYGEADSPRDFFLQGLIEKGLDALESKDLEVEEKECMAKGDDRCLFVARPKD
ncbi:hypothetical protein AQV86_01905 [Nanohaloarchaea archaeon SG9]|nr:hypothetical protein AQV86_01905 [Nanohaloarchaea archaeon SG9]